MAGAQTFLFQWNILCIFAVTKAIRQRCRMSRPSSAVPQRSETGALLLLHNRHIPRRNRQHTVLRYRLAIQ